MSVNNEPTSQANLFRTVGIVGGGQLGRMLAYPAQHMGVKVAILDPSASSPAGAVADTHVAGSITDASSIDSLAKVSSVLTVEIEHVDCDGIRSAAEAHGIPAHPDPSIVQIIQDKYAQKVHFKGHDVPLPSFMECSSVEAIKNAGQSFGYPLMLKAKRLAYDGRGNYVLKSQDDIAAAIAFLLPTRKSDDNLPLYAESWVPFVMELAIMVARSTTGEISSFPVVETVQKDNICHTVVAPARISKKATENATKAAEKAIASFDNAVGIFGVELFLLSDDTVLLNEIAPRPHNSGHYTIEGCYSSQFEQHLRCILGLPLGNSSLRTPVAVMLNILGTKGAFDSKQDREDATWAPCARALTVSNAYVHWYCKGEAREGRKMGHITILGSSYDEVLAKLRFIEDGTPIPVPKLLPGTLSGVHVGIVMGSTSDLPTMKAAAEILRDFGVPFELTVVSAHRTPERLHEYAKTAAKRGLKCIIAGAGGAAHLPGMLAAATSLPVIGVPVPLRQLDGVDSLYSIVQMPRGIPVATVAIGNSTNAGLLAVRMLGMSDPLLQNRMDRYLEQIEKEVMVKVDELQSVGWEKYQ